MTMKKNIITLLTLITLTSCTSQPAKKEEVTTPVIDKYAFTENNLEGLITKKKENNTDKGKEDNRNKGNEKKTDKSKDNKKKADKDKGKLSDNKKDKKDDKNKDKTEKKDKEENETNKADKSEPKNNTPKHTSDNSSKPKEKPAVKEVSRNTVRETISRSENTVYNNDKYEGDCDKSYGEDGFKEYEVIKYSDGTEKKNLINSKDPVNDVLTCGTKTKPHAYKYTNEWDGVYRTNQLIYNNRERFFTSYQAGYYDDIQAGIDRNEVAAVTERPIDVNDGYSTYFSAHNTTIFEDIEKDLSIGDTILITDSYGNAGEYQVTDKYIYQRGEDTYGTPAHRYFYEEDEEVIYLQTCVEGSATLLYIYTAVRV